MSRKIHLVCGLGNLSRFKQIVYLSRCILLSECLTSIFEPRGNLSVSTIVFETVNRRRCDDEQAHHHGRPTQRADSRRACASGDRFASAIGAKRKHLRMEKCDDEQLHLIGSIQGGSDAYVLVISSDLKEILAASTNTPANIALGIFQPQLSDVTTKMAPGQVRSFFRSEKLGDVSVCVCPPHKYILEIEPACGDRRLGEVSNLGRIVEHISVVGDAHSITAIACDDMFEVLSMYDRGMVYRFNEDSTGEVVHEVQKEGLSTAYLHLRFPASDIPGIARELYLRNSLRFIQASSSPHMLWCRKHCRV